MSKQKVAEMTRESFEKTMLAKEQTHLDFTVSDNGEDYLSTNTQSCYLVFLLGFNKGLEMGVLEESKANMDIVTEASTLTEAQRACCIRAVQVGYSFLPEKEQGELEAVTAALGAGEQSGDLH